MENYKVNGKKISMPSGWHEVSYKNAVHIIENELNEVECFSLLSGVPITEARAFDDQRTVDYFMGTFMFLSRMPELNKGEIPQSIKLGEDRVVFPYVYHDDPQDLGKLSLGQIVDMKEYFMKTMNTLKEDNEDYIPTEIEMIKMMPTMVSIFIQGIVDKGYDYSKAMKMVEQIEEKISFKDLTSMGYFFLRRLTGYTNGSNRSWHRRLWIVKKWRQVLRALTKRLDSMLS